MKRKDKLEILFALLILIAIIIFITTKIPKTPTNKEKQICLNKCGGYDKLISYSTNLTYNFIKCICAENLENVNSYTKSANVIFDEKTYFFDINTSKELTEKEISLRTNE